jgi:hypothetical protein
MNIKTVLFCAILIETFINGTFVHPCANVEQPAKDSSQLLAQLVANANETHAINAGWTDITDEQLTTICTDYPNLKQLCLGGCKKLHRFDLGSLKQLTILDVSATDITDEQLTTICANNPGIEQLNFLMCKALNQFNLNPLRQLTKLEA